MVYFSLPYFYENKEFNDLLAEMIKARPDYVNEELPKIAISYLNGNFPYSFWNGKTNNNNIFNKVVTYKDAQLFFLGELPASLILDFSNIFIKEDDYKNNHLNMVLDVCKFAGNYIALQDLKLKEYIEKKYPGYNFILSENYSLFNQLEEFQLNDFCLIEIPVWESIENIQDFKFKNKGIITLLNKCPACLLRNSQQCRVDENLNQINYSEQSVYRDYCPKGIEVKLFEEFSFYRKLGYTHFQFLPPLAEDIKKFNRQLLNFFIKKEYHFIFEEKGVL